MVVQHNLQAMNANRMLGITTNAQGKSTERLSSGYKINRAADDAAGLSISEKMRKQIRGLSRASDNAQDGISCVQTAEGALSEVTAMLQRMNELAVQSANGTNSEDDRTAIQDEIKQLTTEIDRVAETTKFNETYLLKGVGETVTKTTGTEISAATKAGKVIESSFTEARGNIYTGIISSTLGKGTEDSVTITYTDKLGESQSKKISFIIGEDDNETAANIAKAINEDEDLKEIFDASTGEDGRLILESDADYYDMQELSNGASAFQLTAVEFWSDDQGGEAKLKTVMKNPDAIGKTTGVAGTPPAFRTDKAEGDAYTLDISKLTDGATVTIDGKTYTYDSTNEPDGTRKANTFKNFGELQKLLGVDYEVSAYVNYQAQKRSVSGVSSINGVTTTFNVVTQETVVTSALSSSVLLSLNSDITTADNVSEVTTGNSGLLSADSASVVVDGTDAASSVYDVPKTYAIATAATSTDMSLMLKITKKKPSEELKTTSSKDALDLNFHVGADSASTNKISVSIDAMDATTLGIRDSKGIAVDLSTEESATKAIDTISEALKKVSAQRSSLGAIQNRLEHTIANLDNIVENTTSAESAIRDTDMAEEMVTYSKNNILAQAGQSMLAQANQSTQGVLSILG
ncbi:flagellin [Acetitomaculum ruminis DSM 5522]|uniref:Flagellin n=1 Tax=Acetitomaculum ruminis DSM 5522 TaxID=1120918 RepID=A0A1I0YNQ2_9FIRM|nr:flagellin [Acetitomaculum ruminis]SFB13753.1 flagellin [Acetitomaculum ruminis DSM 5522]